MTRSWIWTWSRIKPSGWRQDWFPWILASVTLIALGWLVAAPLLVIAGFHQARWLEIRAVPDEDAPALWAVVTGEGTTVNLPLRWDPPGTANFVFVAPDASGAEIRLVGIGADGADLPLGDVAGDARWRRLDDGALAISGPGALRLPEAPRRLALTFASILPGRVTVLWRGERRTVELGSAARSATASFATSGLRSAWVMLPARAIDTVRLTTDRTDGVAVATVTVHTTSPKAFAARDMPIAPACRSGDSINLSRDCAIDIPSVRREAEVPAIARPAIMAAILLFGWAILWAVRIAAPIPPRTASVWPGTVNRRMSAAAHVLFIAGFALAGAFHFFFWDGLPVLYSPDSWDYYGPGRAIANGAGLDVVPSFRTPGYPAVIGGIVAVAGDGFAAIAAAQHLAILLAGAIVYLALRARIGPFLAAFAGIAVAMSPFSAINANVIWTESMFAAFSAAAMSLLIPRGGSGIYRETNRTILGALLLGIAIMIRPPAQLIAAVDIVALSTWWWVQTDRTAALKQVIIHAGLLIAVVGAVSAPWLVEMHRREDVLALNTVDGIIDAPSRDQVLTPASVGTLAAYILYLYQSRLTADLPANAPFTAYMSGYHYANGHVFRTSLDNVALYDSRYPTEILLQSIRRDVAGTARFWAEIFLYNTSFRTDIPVLRYADTTALLREMGQPPRLAAISRPAAVAGMEGWAARSPAERYKRIDALMSALQGETRETRPTQAGMKAALVSAKTVAAWPYITLLGLISAIVIALVPQARPFLTVAAVIVCFLAVHSLFGTANDRYMAPLEPLLYLLSSAGAFAAVQLARRRPR